ncbi:MAG: hypothetical protein HC892_04860 [Saprospiraceae bacterium]|nr:hypothetical protein [Saprospiraceae bacterium]
MNIFFGQVFQTLKDAASNLLGTLLGKPQSPTEEKFMHNRIAERLMYVNAAIQVQEEEQQFLETHMTVPTSAMTNELDLLKRELQELISERKHLIEQLETLSQSSSILTATSTTKLNQYQQDLKIQLSLDKPQEVLDKLLSDLQTQSELYNDVILLSAKLRSVSRQKELGLLALPNIA